MTTKRCTQCGKTKPLSEYWWSITSDDGHRNRCKVCMGSPGGYKGSVLASNHAKDRFRTRRDEDWERPIQEEANRNDPGWVDYSRGE